MALSIYIPVLLALLQVNLSSSTSSGDILRQGSSLSVEASSHDALVSANAEFSAGFFPVGDNAFCFAIWFTKSSPPTPAWMANRDHPVNGRRSRLSLQKNGNLALTDAGDEVWSTNTFSTSMVKLQLLNNGNLVVSTVENVTVLWQSFDSLTDTLLPEQLLTKDGPLISSKSQSNYSSGFYKLYFDTDNVLRLLFQGGEAASIYWPDQGLLTWQLNRTAYNSSRNARFNDWGSFMSSDKFNFRPTDFGLGPRRRLTLDSDGNLRMYSLEVLTGSWSVSWQAILEPCKIHGICGPNSLCSYDPAFGRNCSCLPGFKIKNPQDWSYGCEPEFKLPCNHSDDQASFLQLCKVDFYGYDLLYLENSTIGACQKKCLQACNCNAIMIRNIAQQFNCWLKYLLLNGHRSVNFNGIVYLKIPNSLLYSSKGLVGESKLNCSGSRTELLDRSYKKSKENQLLKFLLWVAVALGGAEVSCILLVWCFLQCINNRGRNNESEQEYKIAATGFRRFTYAELKKATKDFTEEIGRGGGGVVYKGILVDDRVAAIKRLNEANQGEAEFLAEVGTIGKLNHMHLIELWGYCAEGKHRFLVYEYMEHGSLADNLSSSAVNCDMRFEIAVGTARGLAYLHDECLDWIVHCDIKPQNILLDSNYMPKVADFGLSKLLKRGGLSNSSFSKIRGTRGYMAPEWVYNLPITSKVDVYSYGIVVLEMLTGRSPTGACTFGDEELAQHGILVKWVREKMSSAAAPGGSQSWIEQILDPNIRSDFDVDKIRLLVNVALNCVVEDREARPTMKQVVEMLETTPSPE